MATLHPTITFRVKVNADLVHYLHPDRHQTDQDLAITQSAQHDVQRLTWLPGFLNCENIRFKNGDTFTVNGQKAIYLKDNYTTGDNAFLEVVTNV